MPRGAEPPDPERQDGPDASRQDGAVDDASATATALDLSGLPIAGLTRGRLLVLAGVFAAAWILFAFARQVGAAGDLTDRAQALRSGNADLETRVADLQAELALVQRPEFIGLEA